jgi:hypothetical protein
MSTATSGKITRMPQGDQRAYDYRSKDSVSHVPYGLSLLNSISTMSIQEEANLGQSIFRIFLSSNMIDQSFVLAMVGVLNAKRFKIYDGNNQLILYAAEGENYIE